MTTLQRITVKTTGLFGLTLALIAFASGSFADTKDTRMVTQPYATELAAVVAASNRFNPNSIRKDLEYMGAILEKDGLYYYTYTVGTKGHDEVTTLLPDTSFGNTVALWHTHGRAQDAHRYYSPSDTHMSKRLNLPFYLADHTGELKVYSPGDTTLSILTARQLGFHARGASKGSVVKDGSGQIVAIATKGLSKKDQNLAAR